MNHHSIPDQHLKLFCILELEVSEECKRALFEVLCIYNCKNLSERTVLDEQFYSKGSHKFDERKMKGIKNSTWK